MIVGSVGGIVGTMSTRTLMTLVFLASTGVTGCSSSPPAATDAGPPPPIVLTVNSAQRVDSVPARTGLPIAPTFEDSFFLLNITLEANGEDRIPVAPAAFTLTLEDDTTVAADSDGTNGTRDGCDSRSVPLGESTTCNVAFEVSSMSAEPRSLTWSNGGSLFTRSRVPPPD